MRLSSLSIVLGTFLCAGILCLVAASFSVSLIEDSSEISVRTSLDDAGLEWAEVQADGLKVQLSGTAPSEADRFRAISTVGTVVDAARIIDNMDVTPTAALEPPRFSAEILRNDSGISVLGLVPATTDRAALTRQLERIAGQGQVADLLETAAYPEPVDWPESMRFAVTALQMLPRSKVSVTADRVVVKAIADSPESKREFEVELTRAAPPGLRLTLEISAPRPVITPFTLRFIMDETGGRFDACSADTEAARDRILAAARDVGLAGPATCTLGLGVPSPRWSIAAEQSIRALAALGGGSVTFSDADITLAAVEGTTQADFDRVVGELDTALPDVFALYAVLPEIPEEGEEGPPEFTATLSPEGLVQLRGRLSDEGLRQMADSYAKSRFGSANVYTAARVVDDLPADWPVRVLAGLEALTSLTNGAVTVTPDNLTVHGISHHENASASIAQLLSNKLGEAETYALDIAYRAPPPPQNVPPTPEECEIALADILLQSGKITFEPGSATIAAASLETMDAIAAVLTDCGDIRLEIQGHTDSQGRETMNQELSQARAQSVLNELRARRVLTSTYVARGYGETQPIAENDTEAGREANRRIEFRLIRPEPTVAEDSTLDSMATGAASPEASEETENEQN